MILLKYRQSQQYYTYYIAVEYFSFMTAILDLRNIYMHLATERLGNVVKACD